MLRKLILSAAVLSAVVCASSAAMAQEWVMGRWHNAHAPIEDWVNNTCKTKDNTGFMGMTLPHEAANKFDYEVILWCRKDNSDTKWKKTTSAWVTGVPEGLAARYQTGKTAMIGIVYGSGGNTILLLDKQ